LLCKDRFGISRRFFKPKEQAATENPLNDASNVGAAAGPDLNRSAVKLFR
jgi:hypothetical protein